MTERDGPATESQPNHTDQVSGASEDARFRAQVLPELDVFYREWRDG